MTPTREAVRIPIDDITRPTVVAELVFPDRIILLHRVYTSQDPRDGAWYMAEYAGIRSNWFRAPGGGEEAALDDLLTTLALEKFRHTTGWARL